MKKTHAGVRHTLAFLIVVAAATVMVAGRVDTVSAAQRWVDAAAAPAPNPPSDEGFADLLRACLETRDPDSIECRMAQELSGMSVEEFRAKIEAKLAFSEPKPEPKPEASPDLWALMKSCAASRDLDGDACRAFAEHSGLSGEEFAKLADRLAGAASEPELKASKATKNTGMTAMTKDCLSLRNALSGKQAHELEGLVEKVNEVCGKALDESGMSPAEFWTKLGSFH